MKRNHAADTFILCISLISLLLLNPDVGNCQSKSEQIIIGDKIVIHSTVLNEERTILIRLPKDYDNAGMRYPVFYILDGEFFFQQAIGAVNFLSECGYIYHNPIPELIIVGIVNVDRNRDYTPTYSPNQLGNLYYPTSGGADLFTKFLSTELIPYIDSHYRTQPYRILAGWSFGGLFAVYTFFENPHLFSAYLAISPSLWWDQDMYVARADSLLSRQQFATRKLTVTIGSLEGGNMGRSVRDGFIPLMKTKLNKDYPFDAVEILDEDHSFVPYKAIYEGLISLYADWPMPSETINEGFEAIEMFYKNLSMKYGYDIKISEWAYMNLINSLNSNEKYHEAMNIAKKYQSDYPASSWAQCYSGIVYERMNDLESARIHYQEALDTEESRREPDSERIVTFSIHLHEVEKKFISH